jgi:predicted nucleotidyltransferase
MAGVWEHEAVARRSRQWPALERLRAHVEVAPALAGMILVGSFARGEVDPLSDLDVVVVAPDGGFDAAWAGREELHADAALVCWDQRDPGAYDQLKAAVRAALAARAPGAAAAVGTGGTVGSGATAPEPHETPETIEDESAPGA